MQTRLFALLSLVTISIQAQPAIAVPPEMTTRTATFHSAPPIGELGHPFGRITTIAGVIQQTSLGAKSTDLSLVLRIEAVNDRPLAKPVLMPFQIFSTAQVASPGLGRSFRYLGYETGGFTGVPSEAFRHVPAVATMEYQFMSVFQVLREELAQVQTAADLTRFQNRRVQLTGKYRASRYKPTSANTGIPGFQGDYITANLHLADGTVVPLFPPEDKQSLRTEAEVRAYEGKMVSIVGTIQQRQRSLASPSLRPYTTVEAIWLHRSP